MKPVRVYLEEGKKNVFAVALDWPGWCRHGGSAEQALATLEEYRRRYAAVVGARSALGTLAVVETRPGNGTTDFGAPTAWVPADEAGVSEREMSRLVGVLGECWRYFDDVVAASRPTLRKGPRGGGRDRDAVGAHIREAERAYAPKIGTRVAPRTPWVEQRATLTSALLERPASAWPATYSVRRLAWHVLDHAWEIEDRRDD